MASWTKGKKMNIETFDDFNETEFNSYDLKPFQFLGQDDDTLEWLTEAFDDLYTKSQSRLEVYRRHVSMYKGIYYKDYSTTRNPKIAVNFIAEMVDSKKAQRGKHYPSVAVIPNNHNEQNDINNAKSCKMLLDNRGKTINLDELHTNMDSIMFQLGHAFMYIPWNPDVGDEHPIYSKLKEKYDGKIPKSIKKKLGDKDMIKIGDVEVIPVGGDRIFVEPKKAKWEDINYVFYTEWKHIEEIKHEYPKSEVEEGDDSKYFYDYQMSSDDGQVLVRHFFHKPTKYLPEGAYIKFCGSDILVETDFPYEDGELPFVPDTDIDMYDEFWGRSIITRIEQLQKLYNLIYSGTAKDYALGSALKWFIPKGSVNKKDLHSDASIVEYKGVNAPQKSNSSAVNSKSFEFQDRIESKISKQSAVYDISRGDVPTGVTANSALRFLDEQESQRDVIGVNKRKNRILKVYRMMLSRMRQYYTPSDGRMIRIIGDKNEYMIKSFKNADFSKIYDVQLQNTSSLPDTKTGRISAIIDLNMATQTDPIFGKNEVVEMLDLGLDKAFTDGAENPVDSARTVLDMFLNGEQPPEPAEYDDLLVSYSVFTRYVQGVQFKLKLDVEVQEQIKEYILVLEGLMWHKSMKNMKFKMEMDKFSIYPIFFEVPMDAQAIGAVAAQEQGNPAPGTDLKGMQEKKNKKISEEV